MINFRFSKCGYIYCMLQKNMVKYCSCHWLGLFHSPPKWWSVILPFAFTDPFLACTTKQDMSTSSDSELEQKCKCTNHSHLFCDTCYSLLWDLRCQRCNKVFPAQDPSSLVWASSCLSQHRGPQSLVQAVVVPIDMDGLKLPLPL